MCESTNWNRPGLSNAGSRACGRLVAARTNTPSPPSNPSISINSVPSNLSDAVLAPSLPPPMVASGACDLACVRRMTRVNISGGSECL